MSTELEGTLFRVKRERKLHEGIAAMLMDDGKGKVQ